MQFLKMLDATHAALGDGIHHYTVDVTTCVSVAPPPGSATAALQTPVLTCTDAGCTQLAQSWFPLTGGGDAQRLHAHYRVAKGVAPDVATALAAVHADVTAAAGTPLSLS